VKPDPQNTLYRMTSWGDIQLHLGEINAALKAYKILLTIAQQLVQQVPQNTQFKGDLSVSFWRMYQVYSELDDANNALAVIQNTH
jgi:hypothetical protein